MNGGGFLGVIIIGLLAGWIAERSMNRSQGLLTNFIVGLVGAVLGEFVVRLSSFFSSGFVPSLIISVTGSHAAARSAWGGAKESMTLQVVDGTTAT